MNAPLWTMFAVTTDEPLWTLFVRTFRESGQIERFVFVLLLLMSLVSWILMIAKFNEVWAVKKNVKAFLAKFNAAVRFSDVPDSALLPCPHVATFKAALGCFEHAQAVHAPESDITDMRMSLIKPATSSEEVLMMEMQQAAQAEITRLKYGLGFLATVGSTSPFIGLFGTVWGILDTFRALGESQSTSLSVVGPGISASLVATAAGLAVAIPAVMAYNLLLAQINALQDGSDGLADRIRAVAKVGQAKIKPVIIKKEVPA
jgi:biopolymer transport protein ExbB/TolQ